MGKSAWRAFGAGFLVFLLAVWYHKWQPQPPSKISITSPVALWAEPGDAVKPGWPPRLVRPPKGELAAGEKVTILESRRGKSIWAIRIAAADGRTGWIDARDFGVKLSD
ncbi:MAG: hypothetical protein ACT6Q9_18265 [Polaromonas sp.]|uniref:hypothetical protein n=1 Tax=Polaromonas sp. TaxID=1869339 RepID=UPI0040354DF9